MAQLHLTRQVSHVELWKHVKIDTQEQWNPQVCVRVTCVQQCTAWQKGKNPEIESLPRRTDGVTGRHPGEPCSSASEWIQCKQEEEGTVRYVGFDGCLCFLQLCLWRLSICAVTTPVWFIIIYSFSEHWTGVKWKLDFAQWNSGGEFSGTTYARFCLMVDFS